MVIGVSAENNTARKRYFQLLFGPAEGYLCLAFLHVAENGKKKFEEEYYKYPNELDAVLESINRHYIGHNVYFCPQLLKDKRRTKENVHIATAAWADLDECPPEAMHVEPTIVTETSPGRFQALWCFDRPIDPDDAEELSRRIAYTHADQGADRSGWDLTQLLRVPLTYNMKYEGVEVRVISTKTLHYRLKDFAKDYPQLPEFQHEELPFPDGLEVSGETGHDVLQRHRLRLNAIVWTLFNEEPKEDWSKALWQLEQICYEAGMDHGEVFLVARDAKCNKYARDGRSERLLWRDVCRAHNRFEQNTNTVFGFMERAKEGPLLSDEERKDVERDPQFVERYIEWARSLGDAAPQYHQAGAFIALSSLLCGSVRLPTSFGTIIPNLWFMILADTTLTRKSTAMDIAMDMVMEIDPDIMMATDGSIEGLLTSLSSRPGRPSVFLRDEFSGLLEMITKKDYYAGMPELLTKLYDGKMQKRILRKEQIEVRDPRLVLFAGGIKNKITGLLTFEHVSSGFMPRFIFITAESDITRLRPIGPPTERNLGNREAIKNELFDLYDFYATPTTLSINGGKVQQAIPKLFEARMTDDAWVRYNKAEADMLAVGVESEKPEIMTPVYDRLSKSSLKSAILLAAARQRTGSVVIEESDMCRALYYMEGWRTYVQDVMNNVGRGQVERQLETILNAIRKKDAGLSRSALMQNYHLNARDTTQILETLEQRGQITRTKVGRGEVLTATTTNRRIKI